ncbi:MAG: glycosyltransferase family 2 protein [Chloroflexi bacterium]|nr:glycosyltransferase family 2 protein [Chloroflexota bacterium]
MKASIIIPVFNEERTIGEVIDRVIAVDFGEVEKEIVVADDGSTDQTHAIAKARAHRHPELIRMATAPSNTGKGAAIRMGLARATGDILVLQDADLELDPADLPLVLEPIVNRKYDVVYGSRFLRHVSHVPPTTRLANGFLSLLTNLMFGSHLTDMETAYKAFRRETLEGVTLESDGFEIEPEITAKFLRRRIPIFEVPIRYVPRTTGQGKKIRWFDGLKAIGALVRYRIAA